MGVAKPSPAVRRPPWWRRFQAHWQRRRLKVFADPLFGPGLGVHYATCQGGRKEIWEQLLDGLRIPPESPIRAHVRSLFQRQDVAEALDGLVDRIMLPGAERILQEDVVRLSQGLSGHLHVLLRMKGRVPLVEACAEDHRWLAHNFDTLFPPGLPVDRALFVRFVKLIMVRRVVRTLLECLGIEQLRAGLPAPLSISVTLNLGDGPPLVIHTVTPKSAPDLDGHRLDLIQEEGAGEAKKRRSSSWAPGTRDQADGADNEEEGP